MRGPFSSQMNRRRQSEDQTCRREQRKWAALRIQGRHFLNKRKKNDINLIGFFIIKFIVPYREVSLELVDLSITGTGMEEMCEIVS